MKSGDIKIVGEELTDGWKPDIAQTNMEQFLTANDNKVDAVLSENDGMAGGVVAALKAQGLDGKVPVSGQDGDKAALNRVALGTQIVSVWKDARVLGTAAGEAAIAALHGHRVDEGRRRRPFETPEKNTMSSHPAQRRADHQGQPRMRRRHRMDHQGRPLQGRARRVRPACWRSLLSASLFALLRFRRGAGRVFSSRAVRRRR